MNIMFDMCTLCHLITRVFGFLQRVEAIVMRFPRRFDAVISSFYIAFYTITIPDAFIHVVIYSLVANWAHPTAGAAAIIRLRIACTAISTVILLAKIWCFTIFPSPTCEALTSTSVRIAKTTIFTLICFALPGN
jgi:hypothetical protein